MSKPAKHRRVPIGRMHDRYAGLLKPFQGVVVDRNAVVSAVSPVVISVSERQYPASDSVALRATRRIGWNIVRPDWAGKFLMTQPEQLKA